MYVRQPDRQHRRISLPENYSGNAFSQRDMYSDMPPPARLELYKESQEQEYEAVENSEMPESEQELSFENDDAYGEKDAPKALPVINQLNISDKFPFGHGIGSEELLILAVMLLILFSDGQEEERDPILPLMLGLLLFAG